MNLIVLASSSHHGQYLEPVLSHLFADEALLLAIMTVFEGVIFVCSKFFNDRKDQLETLVTELGC